MKYKVKLSKAIVSRVRKLPGNVRNVSRTLIKSLADHPRPAKAKELDGHPNYYRIWVMGAYRIVWEVNDEDGYVDILYVGQKFPTLYKDLGLERPE